MTKNEQQTTDYFRWPTAILWGGAAATTVFWLANIFKVTSPTIKKFLTLNDATGPLSGLFVYSLILGAATTITIGILVTRPSERAKRSAIIIFLLATVLAFLLVFPPIFEPIAEFLK